jgi:hypothetical protein
VTADQWVQVLSAVGLIVTVVVIGFVAWLMTDSLMKTADLPANRGVMIALALLTLVAIGAAAANANSAMIALAGTGMGALAGAVTSLYGGDSKKNTPRPDDSSTKVEDSDEP